MKKLFSLESADALGATLNNDSTAFGDVPDTTMPAWVDPVEARGDLDELAKLVEQQPEVIHDPEVAVQLVTATESLLTRTTLSGRVRDFALETLTSGQVTRRGLTRCLDLIRPAVAAANQYN